MIKADLGDYLYIIIAIVLMLAGGIEKLVKKSKETQALPPQPQQRQYEQSTYEDEEESNESDTWDDTPASNPFPPAPRSIEEYVKHLNRKQQEFQTKPVVQEVDFPEEAQSLETIPAKPEYQTKYEGVVSRLETNRYKAENEIENESEVWEEPEEDYHFDIQRAVIDSEILRRKYV